MDRLMDRNERLNVALEQIRLEYLSARRKFDAFNSTHEGYAVLLEEVDELWDVIKNKSASPSELVGEAKQVAAMALALIVECGE